MIDSMFVLAVLRERGYIPHGESWYDRVFSKTAAVRAILTEGECEIHVFGANFVPQQSVRFTNATGTMFLACLDAAEREARAMSGQGREQGVSNPGREHWAGPGYEGGN